MAFFPLTVAPTVVVLLSLVSMTLLTCTSAQSLATAGACFAQPSLVCYLQATKNFPSARGVVMFMPVFSMQRPRNKRCLVRIRAQLGGLKPGNHGIHIHTYGDVRRSDGKWAGGHFMNPKGVIVPHGASTDRKRHWGDLGNITAWSGGSAGYDRVDQMIRVSGIVGRSVVVHAKPDMGALEQPSGNAGSRVAQCVIGFANPKAPVLT